MTLFGGEIEVLEEMVPCALTLRLQLRHQMVDVFPVLSSCCVYRFFLFYDVVAVEERGELKHQ